MTETPESNEAALEARRRFTEAMEKKGRLSKQPGARNDGQNRVKSQVSRAGGQRNFSRRRTG
ncbi:hypothetical protein [Streptomyces canus]|uniref:hypothetical protein n=1 Tax=Streptomyces canus TaxID=58343 RepID=UPI002E25D677